MLSDALLKHDPSQRNWQRSSEIALNDLVFFPRHIKLREFLIECFKNLKQWDKVDAELNYILELRLPDNALIDRCIQLKRIIMLQDKVNIPRLCDLNPSPMVICTITTCRRLDLFIQTMDSFMAQCDHHLIHKYICVDDNSSASDRQVMRERYPFITFVYKSVDEKGHWQSMRMLAQHVADFKAPYVVHLEDDWLFCDGKHAIQNSLEILHYDDEVHQVQFNLNYVETLSQNFAGGVIRRTPTMLRYYHHEHCVTQDEKEAFQVRYPLQPHCNYWPHFSLRPSVIRSETFTSLPFNNVLGFERVAANYFTQQGYKTAFLQYAICNHIGRSLADRHSITKLNAYDLMREPQFIPFKRFKYVVINEGGMDGFYARNTIDFKVTTLKVSTQHTNNVCHKALWCKLQSDSDSDYYVILEDGVTLCDQFACKVNRILMMMTGEDIIVLGAHMTETGFEGYKVDGLVVCDTATCLKCSNGGSFGYVVSKKGARALVTTLKHCNNESIGKVIQLAADSITTAYTRPFMCHM